MGRLHGTIVDDATGERIDAKVHVLTASGNFAHPSDAMLKVGPGTPFFFSDGEFEVSASRGRVDVLVERGTEYEPARVVVDLPASGSVDMEIPIKRWYYPQEDNWYPGNTHIHYDDKETRPDDRLGIDSSVEGYNVTCVSVLDRRELPYASNKYPIGVMNEFTTAHHVLDIGEENRHNDHSDQMAYGHVMFLRLRNQVDPVSRGFLVDAFSPDYPPLCFACDEAREQGGIVIWCHNGIGMEAPVAAVLGKLDAFNLFDPFWMDPEYDIWYAMMNCGISLPASTGTDWFVCSNNRVYVQQDGAFEYDGWLEGMTRGRTFITNGPALFLEADGGGPGSTIEAGGDHTAHARVTWQSHYPINKVALVVNGDLVETQAFEDGSRDGVWEVDVPISSNGWIAARCSGLARDSFSQAIYAHTSPVHVRGGRANPKQVAAANAFAAGIDRSVNWVRTTGRFTADKQRDDVLDLFRKGAVAYQALADD